MRISDWSSDVCSSDLSAATPDLSYKPPSCVSSLAAATAFAFWRRSKLSHTSFQLPRVAAFEYSVARVSKKLACSTPFSSGASHGSGCSSRSEEHTSELQSLMRISYAVFCWKKKQQ